MCCLGSSICAEWCLMSQSDLVHGRIARLMIFPIKSCGGFDVDEIELDEHGPVLDRRWMLVDETGKFVSQRTVADLVHIKTKLSAGGIVASRMGFGEIKILRRDLATARTDATVWKDDVSAGRSQPDVDQWFSDALARNVRLVEADDATIRERVKGAPPISFKTRFGDSAPLLFVNRNTVTTVRDICGLAEMDETRFRGNVIVEGLDAFVEESAHSMQVGSIACPVVYPCDRCVIITADQESGKRNPKVLSRLGDFRRKRNELLIMGMRVVHGQAGVIRVGDQVSMMLRNA